MDLFADFAGNLALGLEVAFSIQNLWYCLVGVLLGCLVGVLPGLGALIAISLLLPITYHLPTTGAIIMLAGVYFGADYGGGTCSILLGIPGHAAAAVDVLDGYPMTKKGRGGVALFIKAISAFSGSLFGILLLVAFAPLIARWALAFGPSEYVALIMLGLIAASTIGQGTPIKGLAMMLLGLLFGTVGTDVNTGISRFSFGMPELLDGFSLIAMVMGLFALTEVIKGVSGSGLTVGDLSFKLRSQLPTRRDWARIAPAIFRGASLGSLFGALPGTSGGMATFLAYGVEKRISKTPEEFGNGAVEGLAAPEACNNAGVGTAFIPTLTLGIPGDPIMALMLGALMIQGIQPGPAVITGHPDLFWGLVVSFFIGNFILLLFNIPLIGLWTRILQIPYHVLIPSILLFSCLGVLSEKGSVFDIYVLIFFGVLGYLLWLLELDPIPMLLGYVLGPMLEENFRRAMLVSDGNFLIFLTRPITGVISLLTVLFLVFIIVKGIRRVARARTAPALRSEPTSP